MSISTNSDPLITNLIKKNVDSMSSFCENGTKMKMSYLTEYIYTTLCDFVSIWVSSTTLMIVMAILIKFHTARWHGCNFVAFVCTPVLCYFKVGWPVNPSECFAGRYEKKAVRFHWKPGDLRGKLFFSVRLLKESNYPLLHLSLSA